MELRHLRYFLAVAEHGHITRAAEALGIQQPPLSLQIQALERELDVQLFRRKPRGVELTEAGKALYEDARAILGQVDRALARVKRTARGEQGRVVVGFNSSAPMVPFVPRVIRSFQESFPLVSLSFVETGTGELVDGLRSETVDAAFIRSPVADRLGLAVFPLLVEDMVIAVPAGHALTQGQLVGADEGVPLAALAGETFVLYRLAGGPGLYDAILAACHKAGFSPRVGQEAPRVLSTLNLVAAGLGITLVPASLRRLHIDGVAFRRLADRSRLKAPLNLAYRRGEASAAVRSFVNLVQLAAKELASAGEAE